MAAIPELAVQAREKIVHYLQGCKFRCYPQPYRTLIVCPEAETCVAVSWGGEEVTVHVQKLAHADRTWALRSEVDLIPLAWRVFFG